MLLLPTPPFCETTATLIGIDVLGEVKDLEHVSMLACQHANAGPMSLQKRRRLSQWPLLTNVAQEIKRIVKDSKSGRYVVLERGERSELPTYFRDFPTNRALKQGELPKR